MNEARTHLSDEQMTDAYYGDFEASGHLSACSECRNKYDRLREILDLFNQYPVPERDAGHGSAAWSRLLAELAPDRPRGGRLRWRLLTPAFAALLTIAFVTGRLTERGHRVDTPADSAISEKARERVLLMSLSEHLEQAQIVLSNVMNAGPESGSGSGDLAYERDRAHELIGANRLLRQTATRLGDLTDAALLEELERVLLDFANGPEGMPPAELERTQRQIEQRGLLFKVRVSSIASRERGEKL